MNFFRSLVVCLVLFLHGCSCSHGESRTAMRIGVDPNWYPIDFAKQASYINGFTEDLLTEVARYSGIEFEWIPANWDTLQEGLKQKKYEAILTSIEPYDFNRAKYDFSQNFLDLGPVLVVPVNASDRGLDKMGGELVGIVTGDPAVLVLQKYPEIIIRNYGSAPELLDAILKGEIEAAILNRIPAVNYVRDLYQGKLKILGSSMTDAGLRMVTLKGASPHRLKEFDNCLTHLQKKNKLKALLKKWQLD